MIHTMLSFLDSLVLVLWMAEIGFVLYWHPDLQEIPI